MESIYSSLRHRESTSPFCKTKDGWIDTAGFCSWVNHCYSYLDHGAVALAMSSNLELALFMAAADGVCSQVLIVPSSWNQSEVDRYTSIAGIEKVISTRTDLTVSQKVTTQIDEALKPDHSEQRSETNVTRWLIPTSGTTGSPKLIEHTTSSLTRTVKKDSGKGKFYTWGLVYELSRFAGLQVFLQAVIGGSRLVFPDRLGDLESMVHSLVDGKCNALSATPTLWRRMLMTSSIEQLDLKVVTLGGETADQLVLDSLSARYPSARLLHIYASTEAGTGFTVADGRAGFPVSFITNPPAGIEIRIDDEDILLLKPSGRNAQIVESVNCTVDVSSNGWVRTGDQVAQKEDRIIFLGRANGSINVGGNKVFPEEIESVALQIEGVKIAKASARPSPIMGSLVELFVSVEDDILKNDNERTLLKKRIKLFCKERLEPYKVPAIINITEMIEVNEAGKILRTIPTETR